jgi:protein TonB
MAGTLFGRLRWSVAEADSSPSFSEGLPGTTRSRATAFLLVIVIELVMLLAFLTMHPLSPTPPAGQQSVVLQLQPPRPIIDKPEPRRRGGAEPKTAVNQPVRVPQTPPLPRPKTPPKTQPEMVLLSREDYVASDLGALPSRGGGTKGQGEGSESGAGDGPGGVHLYNARWYVEPKHGELAYYLPRGAPPNSWATIACRTVANYHVEDCVALEESPPGSRLANALRQASWQFLVRPPSADGRPLIGSWVRIRFDWTQSPGK